jgi:hypothetical protein
MRAPTGTRADETSTSKRLFIFIIQPVFVFFGNQKFRPGRVPGGGWVWMWGG